MSFSTKIWTFASTLLLAAACATTASSGSIYYGSQKEADAALAAFDKDNPSCQLWTNWQKMCSRTGEDGATWCVKSSRFPVKPSTPFCADYPRYSRTFSDRTLQQKTSSLRFCHATKKNELRDSNGITVDTETVCNRYQENRPFDGRRKSERLTRLCIDWERGRADILYCSTWKDVSCNPQDGSGKRSRPPEPEEIWSNGSYTPDTFPVMGTMCTE